MPGAVGDGAGHVPAPEALPGGHYPAVRFQWA
jgi:hypothetical protein